MHRIIPVKLALAAAVLLAALPLQAETIYKLIDKKGKVTYVEKPPKDFDGKVIRIEIDPNANTATLPTYGSRGGEGARPESDAEKIIRRKPAPPTAPTSVEAAREKVEAARKALADARDNPREGDIQRMGKVGGGTRPVFSPEYEQRLQSLEKAVKDAEDELRKAEGR